MKSNPSKSRSRLKARISTFLTNCFTGGRPNSSLQTKTTIDGHESSLSFQQQAKELDRPEDVNHRQTSTGDGTAHCDEFSRAPVATPEKPHKQATRNMSAIARQMPTITVGSITGWQLLAAQCMGEGTTNQETESVDKWPSLKPQRINKQQERLEAAPGGSIEDIDVHLDSDNAEHQLKSPREDSLQHVNDPDYKPFQTQPITTVPERLSVEPYYSHCTGQLQRDYEVLHELGKGAFGRAYKARRRCDGLLVCIKTIELSLMTPKERRLTRNEVKVLSELNHPNIVTYYDCFFDNGSQHIVMEYCEGGDLEKYLKSRAGRQLDDDEVMMLFVQLCLALHYIHEKGVIHRDVKASNIFMSHATVKLGDFGVARVLDGACASTIVGTPHYLAPEVIQDKPYDSKSDVWAAGCVLYELAALRHAFHGQSISAIAVKILRGCPSPLPPGRSAEISQLVNSLLKRRAEDRPSIGMILQLEYVQNYLRLYRERVELCMKQQEEERIVENEHKEEPTATDTTISIGGGLTALPVTTFKPTAVHNVPHSFISLAALQREASNKKPLHHYSIPPAIVAVVDRQQKQQQAVCEKDMSGSISPQTPLDECTDSTMMTGTITGIKTMVIDTVKSLEESSNNNRKHSLAANLLHQLNGILLAPTGATEENIRESICGANDNMGEFKPCWRGAIQDCVEELKTK